MILFFLPHAGGAAKSYSSFKRFLPKELNVVPMELSGHFTRSSEPLFTDIPSCVSDLLDKHAERINEGEYAIFGHSLGTMLSAELVHQIKKRGMNEPKHIFLSGRCAPDEPIKCFRNSDTATDEEIIDFFYSGTPSAMPKIDDEELINQLNRLLCTDVRMCDSFRITPDEVKFGCDITVFEGTEDAMLKGVDMNGWKRFTDGSCDIIKFSGDHFYYNQHKEEICGIIAGKLGLK